MVMII